MWKTGNRPDTVRELVSCSWPDALRLLSSFGCERANLRSVLALTVVAIYSCRAAAEDWPGWMGPKLTGISQESDWSVDWPEDGLPVVWQNEIGIGFSSVSIVDGRVYTTGHAGSG